jgi:hypothetical protein
MELELAEMLEPFAPRPNEPTIQLVGRGVRHAFGRASGFAIRDRAGDDHTEEVRQLVGPEKFDAVVERENLRFERSALRGPADDEVEELRAYGWRPEATAHVAERRAAAERKLTPQLEGNGPWRRDRLRDVVSARELCIEFDRILPRALGERGLSLSELFAAQAPDRARAFVRALPSSEVAIELKTAWHRNPAKTWAANDVHDIDALALAVPYCDIVVTEKACHHVLKNAGIDKRMHTLLLRDLRDLTLSLNSEPIRPLGDSASL